MPIILPPGNYLFVLCIISLLKYDCFHIISQAAVLKYYEIFLIIHDPVAPIAVLFMPLIPPINLVSILKLYDLSVGKSIFNVGKGTFQRIQLCYFFHVWNLQRIERRNQFLFQFD